MVEFALPRNSRVRVGKTWPAPEGAANLRTIKVYRWVKRFAVPTLSPILL